MSDEKYAGLTLQVYQEARTGRGRRVSAHFDCTRHDNGTWNVHFWADYAPIQEINHTDADVWYEINVIREEWRRQMKERN